MRLDGQLYFIIFIVWIAYTLIYLFMILLWTLTEFNAADPYQQGSSYILYLFLQISLHYYENTTGETEA